MLDVTSLAGFGAGDGGSSHLYWRLVITANTGGNPPGFTEIEMAEYTGGPDQCSGGTASASGSYGSTTPAQGFDNSTGTDWWANVAGVGQWIQYAFAAPVSVGSVKVRSPSALFPAVVTGVDIYSSDDGVNFTLRKSAAGLSSSHGAWSTINF